MTPTSPSPPPVSVRGGTGGIAADCADLLSMARRFGGAATDTIGAALALHGYLLHPAIVLSAPLDPAGCAAFEAGLLAALDGARGLTRSGWCAGALDVELRAAAVAYEAADTLAGALHDAALGALEVAPAVVAGTQVLVATRDPIAAAQAALARDPEAADTVVDLLDLPALVTAASAAIPDGRGVVRRPGLDRTAAAGVAPRSLVDLLEDLAQRNHDPHHGAIDVRIITMADGSRRAVVDITGTKTWGLPPAHDVTGLTTDGRALVGERTAYEQGVLAAMHRAGVGPHDRVMLVGHSEGGMVAVTAARDAVRSGDFDVTHVITVGAPIGLTAGGLPSSVRVLALENDEDVVPHLDGRRNPDRPNITTVTARAGNGTLVDDHDIEHGYLPIARGAEASTDQSVRDYLRSADGYLSGTSVETHVFQIQRR